MIRIVTITLTLCVAATSVATAQTDFGAKARAVFELHCHGCHADGEAEGGLGYLDDFKQLVEKKRVIPGNLATSTVYSKMRLNKMPPLGDELADARPTEEEIQIVADWITAGAPVPGEAPKIPPPREFVGLVHEFRAMYQHLRQVDPADREYIRFFTLRNWYNNPSRTLQELDHSRAALGKVVNSLSWRQRLVQPIKLDKHGIFYAFDIRDLTWTQETWSELLSFYPYGLKHDRYPDDPQVNQLARDVAEMTHTDIPIIRADWFAARATRPPLYHILLQIPETDKELERKLGVEVEQNILQGRAARAGMTKSGISEQHRMVERHDAMSGYYWKSYDFKPTSPRGDLTLFPLGPRFDRNRYDHLAFIHDGGELIFRLPNGLQGYMLIDGKGNRIDEGPSDVVADRTRVSGDTRIVNGVSCMACHAQGMIDVNDVVRESTSLGGGALQLLRRLYPPKTKMNEYVEADRRLFRSAAVASMQAMALDRSTLSEPDGSVLEPISSLAKYYATQALGVDELAAELGVENKADFAARLRLDKRFRSIGLGPVATGKGKMKRILWEDASRGFRSPFQRAALLLELGAPKAVAKTVPQ